MGRNIKLGNGQFVYDDNSGNPLLISGDLGSGNTGILLQDSNRIPIARFGRQLNGSLSLKFFDINGVGVAEFGRTPDTKTSLKIADSGVEVSSASDDQLIFNSNQDVFKIVKKITGYSIPSFSATWDGSHTQGYTSVTIPHSQSSTPIVQVYAQLDMIKVSDGTVLTSSYVPLPVYPGSGSFNTYMIPVSGGDNVFSSIIFGVNSTNVYVQADYLTTSNNPVTFNSVPLTVFVLQETAN